MGDKQRKKQRKKHKKKQRYIRNIRASKPSPTASPGTMTPVPISYPGDYTTVSPKVDEAAGCPHVERGVKLEKVRTQFQTKPPPQCQSCTRSRPSRAKAGAKKDLWICLACGNVGCGWQSPDVENAKPSSPRFGHAKTHRDQSLHPIVMQWGDSLHCWCLDCDIQITYPADDATSTQGTSLRKAAALLQESISGRSSSILQLESGQAESGQAESSQADSDESPIGPAESGHLDSGLVAEQPSKSAVRPFVSRRVIKGLMNLGNTCFFNSVMQNLVGVSMLRDYFSQESSVQEGILKKALRNFFQDMDPIADGADGVSGRTIHTRSFGGSVGNAVSPRVLFSAICTKAPRFKGFQQQDSHELLRCLLDGLHMEEESMRKSVESKGPEAGPKEVPETFVERMFGMQLSSTVSCCECGHSSVVYEPYLDLSLPIPSKQERSRVESIRVQLPKLIAPRSQGGNASVNGVLSVQPAPFDSVVFDSIKPSALEDPQQARKAPVHGCSLGPLSVLDGGVVKSEGLRDSEEKEMASTASDDKVFLGQGSGDSPSTTSPCEIISEAAAACSSGSGKSEGWLEFVGDTSQGMSGESAAMSFLDQSIDCTASVAPDSNESQEVEIGGFSTGRGEEIVDHSPGDMFSMQGGGREALDDGNQMEEETIEYGPQLPGAEYRVENKPECLELVLFGPDVSSLPSEVKDQASPSCLGETSSVDREITSPSDTKLEAIVPAEDDSECSGVASLFGDEHSFSRDDTASHYKSGPDANNFSTFDSIATIPSFPSDLGQIFGGRAVSVGGVREVETYPIMSLEGCLQAFTKTEVLSGENAWGCENCTRLAHGLRDPDRSEETVDANGSRHLSETDSEMEPSSVGNSALDAPPDALDAEGDVMQGEWESLVLEDRVMEDLSTSTNSLSIVVVPQARDACAETSNNGYSMLESSPNEMADGEQNAAEGSGGRAGSSSAEVGPVEGPSSSKSHNTLKRSQSLDCFADSASVKGAEFQPSSCSKAKEDAEEPYVMLEASSVSADAVEDDTASRNGRRRRNSGGGSSKEAKGRNGKVSARGLEDGAKKPEPAAPKLVTVKRDATKRFLISKAPLVLTVHLKRFAQDLHGRLSKLSGHITFHEQLDLGPFIDQRDGVKRDVVYQLIGTVEHSGTMRGGHYVAYVKGPDSTVENDADNSNEGGSTWYYISDSHVRKTSLESVLQSEAYLLFYERRTFE